MVKVFDFSLAKGPWVHFPVEPKKLFPSLHLTCGAGAVDNKDLADSSDQGNTWLFVHPTLGIMGKQWCTLNDLLRLKKKWQIHIFSSIAANTNGPADENLHINNKHIDGNQVDDAKDDEEDDDEWEQVGPKNKSSVTRGVSTVV